MAKKVIEVQAQGADAETESTGVAIIEVITERPAFIDLIKYKPKEESLKVIKAKRAEYDKVVIDGVDDTANYKVVVANMGQMKKDRMAFENAAYDNVIDPLKAALKEYAADIDAVVEEFKAGEKAERDKKDFIDNEKKRIKQEAEEAKQRAALLRINELNVLGAVFDGSTYSFEFDAGLTINTLQLKDFDDQEFQEFVTDVKTAYEAEQERLNNEKAEQALAAEKQRLQAEQNAKDLQALNDKRTKIRLKETKLLGYIQNELDSTTYMNPDIGILIFQHNIEEDSDEAWEQLVYDIEHYEESIISLEESIEKIKQVEEAPMIGYSAATGNPPIERSTIADDFNDVDSLDDELHHDKPEVITQIALTFTASEPFTDSDISGKMKMRVFPAEYRDKALAGIETIAGDGVFQGLQWVILKK